jgi:hypothetical protein
MSNIGVISPNRATNRNKTIPPKNISEAIFFPSDGKIFPQGKGKRLVIINRFPHSIMMPIRRTSNGIKRI